jgi:hypothetical protein
MERIRTLSPADLGMVDTPPREMTAQEEATVIAALRLWQNLQDGRLALMEPTLHRVVGLDYFEDIATNAGEFVPLDIDGVDAVLDDIFGIV